MPRGYCPTCRQIRDVVEYHPEHIPATAKALSYTALIGAVALLLIVLLAVASFIENQDQGAELDYACSNAVGWLLDPTGRSQYEQRALEVYQDAEESGDRSAEDVFRDLVYWYTDGNEMAVEAFVDVNSCLDRVNRQLEDEEV